MITMARTATMTEQPMQGFVGLSKSPMVVLVVYNSSETLSEMRIMSLGEEWRCQGGKERQITTTATTVVVPNLVLVVGVGSWQLAFRGE